MVKIDKEYYEYEVEGQNYKHLVVKVNGVQVLEVRQEIEHGGKQSI